MPWLDEGPIDLQDHRGPRGHRVLVVQKVSVHRVRLVLVDPQEPRVADRGEKPGQFRSCVIVSLS